MQPNQDPTQQEDHKASLGFSNMLREQLFQHNNPQMAEQPTEQPQDAPVAPETAPQPTETQQDIPVQPEVDPTAEIEAKITELETTHKQEIDFLKSQMNDSKIKNDYEKKIADLEKKYTDEIKGIKSEIKSILNA